MIFIKSLLTFSDKFDIIYITGEIKKYDEIRVHIEERYPFQNDVCSVPRPAEKARVGASQNKVRGY